MFKKGLEVKPGTNIKSSERRRLASLFKEDDIEELRNFKVPEKLSKAVFNSLTIKKGTLYFDAETSDPVFFQDRNSGLFPLLHGLWSSLPDVCLPVIITHDFVIERLVGGANLMIKGCLEPFGNGLKPNAIVAVVNYKQPKVPIAIGKCLMDLENKNEGQLPGQGVAVEIWTVLGDEMTSLGRSLDEILETVDLVGDEETDLDEETLADDVERIAIDDNKSCSPDEETSQEVQQNDSSESHEDGDNNPSEDEYVMTTEDIDEMFKRSVLYTLSQDTLDLPISATQFMSGHVLNNLPVIDASLVNMKKTSWKKTSKFLKAIEKDNLIKLKGKDADLTIISVAQRDDPRIAEFVPYRIRKTAGKCSNLSNESSASAALITETYLKPTNAARMMFNKLDEKYDAVYTEKEVKFLIQRYIKENPEVVSPKNKQMIVPDSVLSDLGIKKEMKRGAFTDKVLSTFSRYYAMYREGDKESNDITVRKRTVPRHGTLPNIKIVVESVKVGRRVATRVSGCEKFYIDIEKFSGQLKIKCSGSTSISEEKEGLVVSVQGKHDATAIDLLSQQWGVPARLCLVENKTKRRK